MHMCNLHGSSLKQQWTFSSFQPPFHELHRQAICDETKKMNAMSAALRRLCSPKPSSGKLEVSAEIYKQWKQGGTQRKALLSVFENAGGDKDFFFGKSGCGVKSFLDLNDVYDL